MVEKSNTEKLNDLTELAKDFSISIADVKAVPMYDLDEIAIEVSKKYAMVFQVGTSKWNYGWDSDNNFAEDFAEELLLCKTIRFRAQGQLLMKE